jgi:hypothetical protein
MLVILDFWSDQTTQGQHNDHLCTYSVQTNQWFQNKIKQHSTEKQKPTQKTKKMYNFGKKNPSNSKGYDQIVQWFLRIKDHSMIIHVQF